MGTLGLRKARRAKGPVTYHMYIASGGRPLYTLSVELVYFIEQYVKLHFFSF